MNIVASGVNSIEFGDMWSIALQYIVVFVMMRMYAVMRCIYSSRTYKTVEQ